MFRRDPIQTALAQVSAALGRGPHGARELPALTSLARSVFRRGGVLGVARADQRLIVPLGGVPATGCFELASVSKPFTAALAQALVRSGELAWDAPLARLGGPFRRLPPALTARRLATHTAGVPMHPARVAVTTFTHFHDPYGPFSAGEVIRSAGRWARPPQVPTFGYSNLGVGVLALALAYAAGEEPTAAGYGRALAHRLTGPLGLDIRLRPQVGEFVSPTGLLGHQDPTGFGPLAGAGGLYGRAGDLLNFGLAHLEGRAGLHWQEVQRPRGLPPHLDGVAPGWFETRGVRWHDGVARGTRSGLGFDTASGHVVVMLARGGVPLLGVRGAVPLLLLRLLGPRA